MKIAKETIWKGGGVGVATHISFRFRRRFNRHRKRGWASFHGFTLNCNIALTIILIIETGADNVADLLIGTAIVEHPISFADTNWGVSWLARRNIEWCLYGFY